MLQVHPGDGTVPASHKNGQGIEATTSKGRLGHLCQVPEKYLH